MPRRFEFVEDEADRAVLMRITDIISSAERWRKPCFSHFLTEHEQAVAGRLKELSNCRNYFYGGFDEAQRRIFCALPENFGRRLEKEDYPFKAVTMLFPKGYTATHRDILGSLMALKLKREAVGDILVGDCLAVVFLLDAAAKLVLEELDRIGRVGVKCISGEPEELPAPYRLERREGVVSSLRTDAVVSLFTGLSRSESAKLISQGMVSKNSQEVSSPSKEMAEGDRISVRGHGKFQLESICGETRKGRLRITYNKFV